jgi:hypothetical protein
MKAFDPSAAAPWMLTAAPLLGLVVNVVVQLVLCRLRLGVGQVRRQFVSFGCGLLATALLLALLLAPARLDAWDRAGYLALHGLSYVFLGFIFFNVINLNISSLRIRMLKEYLAQHPRPLSDDILRQKFNVRDMLTVRLERLTRGGQIDHRDGRYCVRRATVVLIGHFFARLRAFLLPS